MVFRIEMELNYRKCVNNNERNLPNQRASNLYKSRGSLNLSYDKLTNSISTERKR